MLFTSHKNKPVSCSFCGRSREPEEHEIALYGYTSSDKNPVICDQCVIDTVTRARDKKIETSEIEEDTACDFCGKTISQYSNIYMRRECGICVDCISDFVKILLETDKIPGISRF